ncbi:MAG: hypothetical protein IKN50_02055 [Clostridia bacterium]|nr:hypothetical protein [Clostridia bacterium]
MDPYQNLANAIIIQAAKDYKIYLRRLRRNPNNKEAQAGAAEIERFFRSDYYRSMTNVDGELLIKKLKEE